MSELCSTRTVGDVAVITMDDGKANALSFAMIEAIDRALDAAVNDAQAVVLAGREGKFSAGFDLAVMQSGPEDARKLVAAGGRLCAKLFELPVPVVAACTGHALAAGALLLLSSDWRIGAATPAKIGLNEVAIGLPLPQFAADLAQQRLSRQHLTRATAFAHIHDPAAAVEAGFLDELDDDPVGAATTEAARLAEGLSGFAFSGTRRTWRTPVAQKMVADLDTDLEHFALDPDVG